MSSTGYENECRRVKFKLTYLLIFLLPVFKTAAQPNDTVLTRDQTEALILNISNHAAHVRKEYGADNKLVKEEYFGIPGLIYKKYYHSNGQLSKQGFYYVSDRAYHAVGIWQYYNTKGELYKEADLYTRTRKLYGMDSEPHDTILSAARKKADDYMIAHLGMPFFEEYFRYDARTSNWSSERNSNTYDTWFDTPYLEDSLYFFFYYKMIFDGEEVNRYSLLVNQDKIVGSEYDSLPDCVYHPERCKIAITLEQAREIATNKNFKCSHYNLGYSNAAWYWNFHITDYQDSCKQETRGRTLSVNCLTGETAENKWTYNEWHHNCPYPYKHPNRHEVPLKAGEKRAELNGPLEINVPEGWQQVEEAHENGKDRKYFASGKNDTLFFDSFFLEINEMKMVEEARLDPQKPHIPDYNERICPEYLTLGPEERKEKRECDSLRTLERKNYELMAMRHQQVVDSIDQAITQERLRKEKREQERKALQDDLEKTFAGCVSGKRTVTCSVKAFSNDTYRINIKFRDHIYNYPDYFVCTKELDLDSIKAMAAIIRTIRFMWE